jgi:hypothetical protein
MRNQRIRMKKKILLVLIASLLLTVLVVGAVYAQEETPTPTEDTEVSDPVCDGTRVHPVLEGFSVQYNIPYESLLVYYCQLDVSVGEIALALQTNQRTDGETSVEDLFSQRVDDGLGWGEIWQSLNLIGNGGEGQGEKALVRNTHRIEFQEQIQNEGEGDQIQNESQNQENNGNNPDTPPGLEEGNGNNPDTPPGQDEDQDNGNKPDTPPGQDEDQNNGNKPDTPPGQDEDQNNGNKPDTPPGQSKDGKPGKPPNGPGNPPGQEN